MRKDHRVVYLPDKPELGRYGNHRSLRRIGILRRIPKLLAEITEV